jgi:hypothetical protein
VGNYGLVWKDAGTALVDYGNTSYTNGKDFQFAALGATTPALWYDLAVYLIAMTQSTNDIQFKLNSPGLDPGPTAVVGHGADDALFSKIAMPLGHGCVGWHPALVRNLALRRELSQPLLTRSATRRLAPLR